MSFFLRSTSKILQNITQKTFYNVLPSVSNSISGCPPLVTQPISSRLGSTYLTHLVPTQYSLFNPISNGILVKRIDLSAVTAMTKPPPSCNGLHTSATMRTNSLLRMNRIGPRPRPKKKGNPLGSPAPMLKGVVLKTVIKKPRKPNSANRKCVLVRLSNGKELVAFVPGEGHSLQEHNVVMVRPGRLRDTPGVKVRCVRGCYDLGHVIKKTR